MNPGTLRHMVTIQKTTQTQNARGGTVDTWSTFATRRASINPVKGTEKNANSTVRGDTTHVVVLRYLAGVTTKHRIQFGTRTFEILAALNPGERNRQLNLECREENV